MESLSEQGPVFLIEVDKISPNPFQPRRYFDEEGIKELASSIREFGILQPLIVTKIEKETETGTEVEYQLIAGERRWLASKSLGLERVPAIIRNVELDRERLELAIIENVQRTNLSPIESARAYARLQDEFRLTQREVASRIGKSREVIANTLRLLNLPSHIQDAISENKISESQARLLLTVPNGAQQEALFQDILKNNLSVRDLKTKILQLKTDTPDREEPSDTPPPDPELEQFTTALEERLGAKVKVKRSGETGEIAIAFYSKEELRGILEKMLEHQDDSQPHFPQSF